MPAAESPPRWLAPLLIVLLAALGGTAGLLAGRAWLTPARPASGPAIIDEGEQVAALELNDLDGQRQTLADYRGKPVLINFWATWCPPCVRELPLLEALHARRDSDGLTVLTIAQEDDPALVRDYLAQHAPALPAWIDPPSQGDATQAFGNQRQVLPFSVLLDAEGRVLQRKAGAFNEAELQDWATLATRR